MEFLLVLIAVAIPLWLNLRATHLVASDSLSERNQKFAQLLFVWLVPIIGAIIVLAIHRREEPPPRQYREPPDPGDDFGFSGRALKDTRDVIGGDE